MEARKFPCYVNEASPGRIWYFLSGAFIFLNGCLNQDLSEVSGVLFVYVQSYILFCELAYNLYLCTLILMTLVTRGECFAVHYVEGFVN